MLKKSIISLALLFLPLAAIGQITDDGKPVKVVTDADVGVLNVWHEDTVYNLHGFVYVESGEVLIIEPGTIIKGDPGQGANASALVVAQGGQIIALGSSDCPVVFTSISDDVDNPLDIPLDNSGRGLWGGLIVLGNARINTTTGIGQIEGIPETEPRGAYGGSNDNDNSGILKYVSIRHGGSEIGAANEINGLTMGAVGRQTIISHVEVFYNLDDGFEWFGGTVNADHLIASFCGDDAFDYDEGWRGCGQFWFSMHATDAGDRGGEHDGGTTPVDGAPYATPLISNATYFGRGAVNGAQRCFEIRDNAGVGYYNSIFSDHGTYGIRIEENVAEPTDSKDRLAAGHIKFLNNIWFGFGSGNSATSICNSDAVVEAALFTSGDNMAADPGISSISRTNNNGLDPRPTDLAGAGWSGWEDPLGVNGFNPVGVEIDVNWPPFEAVNYPGAFDPSLPIEESWLANWSFLSCGGFLGIQGSVCCVNRGNVDDIIGPGGPLDVSDLTYLVAYLFKGGPVPPCEEQGNVDSIVGPGGLIDVSDLTYLVAYLFKGGPVSPAC